MKTGGAGKHRRGFDMYNYDVLYEKLLQCDWLSRCGDREEIYQN